MSIDVALAIEADQIVEAMTDDQCDAFMAALGRRVDKWELEHPRSRTVATVTASSPPARRQPSWVEVVRGVQCCDPATVEKWRVFRECLLTLGLIVLVASAAAVVFGSVGVGIVLVAVFAVCAVASKGITGGKASVCH